MSYTISLYFNDGDSINVDGSSLVEGVIFAQEIAHTMCDELEEVFIISNETGEIVYSIFIERRVEINFYVNNPYSL